MTGDVDRTGTYYRPISGDTDEWDEHMRDSYHTLREFWQGGPFSDDFNLGWVHEDDMATGDWRIFAQAMRDAIDHWRRVSTGERTLGESRDLFRQTCADRRATWRGGDGISTGAPSSAYPDAGSTPATST